MDLNKTVVIFLMYVFLLLIVSLLCAFLAILLSLYEFFFKKNPFWNCLKKKFMKIILKILKPF
jgi:hypothetical protein